MAIATGTKLRQWSIISTEWNLWNQVMEITLDMANSMQLISVFLNKTSNRPIQVQKLALEAVQ
jgi:hypothetical protein